MLPIMFLARKLDAEDENIVFMLRCAYFGVQTVIVLTTLYIFMLAQKIGNGKYKDLTIYVPPAPQPFADPNAKKQYKQALFGEHIVSTARSLLVSTIFGIIFTAGLHFYKGMIVGLCMQSLMAPLNLFDNAIVKGLLLNGGLNPEDNPQSKKMFDEKYKEDLTPDDEVVDANGDVKTFTTSVSTKKAVPGEMEKKEEQILLDTWDEGVDADIKPLMEIVSKKNINSKTSESGWTICMILAAIGVKETAEAMKKIQDLGANPAIVDGEGWNALHWAAFHGSVDGAAYLLSESGFNGLATGLHTLKDKEGKTALEHAVAEGNDQVAKVIKDAIASYDKASSKGLADQDGLRQRK